MLGTSFLLKKFDDVDRSSLCTSSWPGTPYADQTSLQLTEICLESAGIKRCGAPCPAIWRLLRRTDLAGKTEQENTGLE